MGGGAVRYLLLLEPRRSCSSFGVSICCFSVYSYYLRFFMTISNPKLLKNNPSPNGNIETSAPVYGNSVTLSEARIAAGEFCGFIAAFATLS